MTEEESEKFNAIDGVTFVLPDSYIDTVNKEYGGDKYINGTIIPRPPPVQYWKQGRNRDRGYGREGQTTNQQYRPPNGYQISRDGRNHGAPQNSQSQQNYAAPGPGERRDHMPMNRNHGAPQNYPSQQNYAPPGPGERRDPMPMSGNYAPGGMGTYESGRGDPTPPYQGNYNQGGQGDYSPQQQRDFPKSHYVPPAQGNFVGANRNYGPSQDGTYGRGAAGYQGRETYGASGQGASSGSEHSYPGHGEGQRFSQEEQRKWQGEQRTNVPRGPTGSDQVRHSYFSN
ncbi:hypothetical protein FH972_024837 [Carpinus fangiana]|uniref:MORF/ORRM1/DAG-like MORF domain-containing protein n=1 Tax=Carpinus fangiana TaxID=176857 RepID=A0A5N6KZ96_9ROSI|nr:hypothetical protein FH972_024837 [Carpinus fangiana]